jgi:hypothetical protein
MVNVPGGIRVNSIPKELENVFSKAKTEAEKKMLLKTRERHMHMPEKFFTVVDILLIATP